MWQICGTTQTNNPPIVIGNLTKPSAKMISNLQNFGINDLWKGNWSIGQIHVIEHKLQINQKY
jgi:hypothetical protein